jgi:uncharacterized membrane protein (DUF106 family)
MLGAFLDVAFAPVLELPIYVSIAIIAGLITVFVTLINRKFTDIETTKTIKKKIESTRAKLLEAQKTKDKEKMDGYMKKMMDINSEYMKLMTKPMMVSIIISIFLLIFIFPWLNGVYEGQVIGTFPDALPLVGGKGISWIIWYIVCSLAISIGLRKALRM